METKATISASWFWMDFSAILFLYRRQIENPTISFHTKSRETLKLYNESYYRKVKGQNYLKQVTISNEAVQDNTLIKSRVGTLNYIVNGKVNYSIDNKRINSSLPIIDLFPTDREYIIFFSEYYKVRNLVLTKRIVKNLQPIHI